MNIPKDFDKKAHYYDLRHPLEGLKGFLEYTTSNSREKWVECEIVEDEYKIEDGYNILLRSLEPGYGSKSYDQYTFFSFLKNGLIVKKEPGMECVEEHWEEPLTNNINLHHSAYTLKIKPNKKR